MDLENENITIGGTMSAANFVGDGSGLSGVTSTLVVQYPITYQILNSSTINEQLIPNGTVGALGTFLCTANRCYLNPFCLGMDYTVTKLAVEVTTLGASSTFYIGIYELDTTTFLPIGAPIAETTGLAGTSTGLKTGTLAAPVNLTKGTLYGVSILSNVQIIIRGTSGLNWWGGAVGVPSVRNSMNELRSPGFTSLPTNLVPVSISNGVAQPGIALYRN